MSIVRGTGIVALPAAVALKTNVGRTATRTVAASDADDRTKEMADYVCDGTDDHEEVHAAIAALPSVGGTVMLSAGTFNGRFAISEDNVSLIGQGRKSTMLKLPDDTDVAAQVLTITGDNAYVARIGLDGNKANQATNGDPSNFHRQSDGIGIYADECVIENCYVARTQSHAIIVWNEATSEHGGAPNASADAGARSGTMIIGNLIEDTGIPNNNRAAIDLATGTDSRRSVISNNRVIAGSDTRSAVTMHTGSEVSINNNICDFTNGKQANLGIILHTGCRNASVVGNIMIIGGNSIRKPFVLQNATDVTVVGNVVFPADDGAETPDAPLSFLEMAGTDEDITITGNVFRSERDSARFIVFEGADASRVIIANNISNGAGGALARWIECRTNATTTDVMVRSNIAEGFTSILTEVTGGDGSGVTFRDNIGFPTENSGTATISGTDTFTAVTHGLSRTPTAADIQVTPTSNLENATKFWISDVGASTFRINVDTAPGEGNSDSFAWKASTDQ